MTCEMFLMPILLMAVFQLFNKHNIYAQMIISCILYNIMTMMNGNMEIMDYRPYINNNCNKGQIIVLKEINIAWCVLTDTRFLPIIL